MKILKNRMVWVLIGVIALSIAIIEININKMKQREIAYSDAVMKLSLNNRADNAIFDELSGTLALNRPITLRFSSADAFFYDDEDSTNDIDSCYNLGVMKLLSGIYDNNWPKAELAQKWLANRNYCADDIKAEICAEIRTMAKNKFLDEGVNGENYKKTREMEKTIGCSNTEEFDEEYINY